MITTSSESYAGTPRSPKTAGLLSDEELTELYRWVDGIPLSRPKRNFTRDFSDGCLCAEVIRHLCPRLVELHNYPSANSTAQKVYNWNTLNFKILRRLGCALTDDTIQQIVSCKPGIVETVLFDIRQKLVSTGVTAVPLLQPSGAPQSQQQPPQPQLPAVPSALERSLPPGAGRKRTAGGAPLAASPEGGGAGHRTAAAAALANILAATGATLSPSPAAAAPDLVGGRAGSQSALPEYGVSGNKDGGNGPSGTAAAGHPGGFEEDKDEMIQALRETVGILQEKIHKLELLLVLKDKRIQELSQ